MSEGMIIKGWRINQLCIIGAILGIISLFLEWGQNPVIGSANAFDLLSRSSDPELWWSFNHAVFFISFFIIGTITAFLSPIGGVVQFCAISTPVVVSSLTWFDIKGVLAGSFSQYGHIGEVLALTSSILVIISLYRPIDKNERKEYRPLKEEMWNIGKEKKHHESQTKKLWRIPHSILLITNQIGFIAALIGLLSLLLPWVLNSGSAGIVHTYWYVMGFEMFTEGFELYVLIFFTIYCAGTLFSLLSPLGGFLQLLSAILLLNLTTWQSPPSPPGWWIPFGELLGIYSGLLAIGSLAWRIRLDQDAEIDKKTFLTICKMSPPESPCEPSIYLG